MASWGPNRNERFQFGGANPIPTLSFATTPAKKSAVILRTDQVSIFLKYTQGTEQGVQLRIDFATPEDHPEDSGAFFEETTVNLNNMNVDFFRPRFRVTGFFRLPLPIVITERIMRVSVINIGGAWTGTGELWYSTGNLRSPLAPITVP